ncbi:MAG TPA: VOC family protein [Thermoanaerobaculia bacterium]|nr:VOC family protein [Thermoanaerobaculia bacterium]
MKIERIGQIAIPVQDVDRAIEFYRDVLGLRFLFRAGAALAFFDCGGVRILLDKPEEKEFANHSSVIYFKVSDIQEAFGHLKSSRVSIAREPHMIARLADLEVWMAFFHDPDNNVLALMSEVPIRP